MITLTFLSCNNQDYGVNNQSDLGNENQNNETPKTAEELKFELLQQENKSPLTYLSSEEVTLQKLRIKTREAGLFRDAEYEDDGARIEGYFKNNATIARFKDIRVKVLFYSQTKTLIDEQSYIMYEYYEPNLSKSFSFKIKELPQAYKSFTFEITEAKLAN